MLKKIKTLFKKKPKNIWNPYKEEFLYEYIDGGLYGFDSVLFYKVAVYEKCLLTNKTRIVEKSVLPENYGKINSIQN